MVVGGSPGALYLNLLVTLEWHALDRWCGTLSVRNLTERCGSQERSIPTTIRAGSAQNSQACPKRIFCCGSHSFFLFAITIRGSLRHRWFEDPSNVLELWANLRRWSSRYRRLETGSPDPVPRGRRCTSNVNEPLSGDPVPALSQRITGIPGVVRSPGGDMACFYPGFVRSEIPDCIWRPQVKTKLARRRSPWTKSSRWKSSTNSLKHLSRQPRGRTWHLDFVGMSWTRVRDQTRWRCLESQTQNLL